MMRPVRLFPVFFLVAAVALGARLMELSSGMSLSGGTAMAQEDGESTPADPADEAANGDSANDANASGGGGGSGAGSGQDQAEAVTGLDMSLPSDEEMRLITQLRQRRQQLDKRAQQLDLQEQLLASTEKRINDKISQLKALENRIQKHLRLFKDREAKQLESVVQVYETMKAKEAAPRFEKLDIKTQLDLVTRMKARKVAALMAEMTPDGASELTRELATMADAPTIEDVEPGAASQGGQGGR